MIIQKPLVVHHLFIYSAFMLLKFNNESEWLSARAKDITSTELAALFGLSSFKSRFQLWHEKKGNVLFDEFLDDNPFIKWGKRLQNAVAAGICEDEGWQAEDLSLFYFTDPARRLGSSLDVKAICQKRGPGLLEVKVTEQFSEENGWFHDCAPVDYEFQIQGELHSASKDAPEIGWGCLGVLGTRQATRLYMREYDAALGALIDQEAEAFWASIEANEPPAPDYSVDSELLAAMRGKIRVGDTINLSLNNRAIELVASYQATDQDAKIHKKRWEVMEAQKKEIKAELHDMIGRNERAIIGDFEIGARIQETDGFFNPGFSFRRFDIKQRKKRK